MKPLLIHKRKQPKRHHKFVKSRFIFGTIFVIMPRLKHESKKLDSVYYMKNLCIGLALVCTTLLISAQENPEINVIKIKIPKTIYKTAITNEITIPLVSTKTDTVDIKADHWDNTVFNPYEKNFVEFPVKLKFSDTTYASPIPRNKVITSRYGWRKGRAHQGIDIDLVTGDSVVSMLDGVVRFARYSSGHGNTVVVRHYNGLETAYAHLSKFNVKENDTIKKGDLLGLGGATGNARGSHLHLVVSYKGEFIHPEYLFDFSSNNAIRAEELWLTKKWTRAQYHNSKRKSDLALIESEEDALASLLETKIVYVVKPGDTLSRISQRNKVSINAICAANAISQHSTLKIGQKLVIDL